MSPSTHEMALPKYQVLVTAGDQNVEEARKRRALYIRPFVLFWVTSMLAEILFLTVAVIFFSGWRDIGYKMLWTLIICPLGMGGAMGGLTVFFLVDHYYGRKAVWFTTVLTLLVLGGCNHLCFALDHYFHYFGASSHPLWFHLRYPFIAMSGWSSGEMLFTDEGQKKLVRFGL